MRQFLAEGAGCAHRGDRDLRWERRQGHIHDDPQLEPGDKRLPAERHDRRGGRHLSLELHLHAAGQSGQHVPDGTPPREERRGAFLEHRRRNTGLAS